MTTRPTKRNSIQTWRAPSKQSPAQTNVSRIFAEPQQSAPSTSATAVLESKLPLPAESLEPPEESRRHKRERDPSPLSPAVVAGADDAASRQRGSSASAPPQERQHSNHPNKRVKRSADADVPESTDGTIRRSSSVLAGGWFGQRDQSRQRPPRPKPVFERQQNASSVQLQPSDVSQYTLASTYPPRAPQTPSLQSANNTAAMASGSQVTPITIPFKSVTNSDTTPSGSPAGGGWFGSLRRAPPQPTKVQEPQPPAISELVSESTKLNLDPPTTLPAPRGSSPSNSKPPTRTRWFGKSVTSSPIPVQEPLLDRHIPPSPTPSGIIEVPSTSSSAAAGCVPATSTVNNAASRYMINIPLLGRSNVKAQEMVVVEDLGTSLFSVFNYSTNIKSTY